MKNKILLIATFILISFGVFASTEKNNVTLYGYDRSSGESFTFVENGITFSIFQNGEFDFYLNNQIRNANYHSRNFDITFNSGYNYDAYVQYDNYGAVIQIENTPIYYDYYGRVTTIGSIDVNYTNNRLYNVGRLYVHYNRYGSYSHCSGYINRYNRNYVHQSYHNSFTRPLFEFRIVSHQAYRNRYQPVRHRYYSDHSRNKYYSKKYRYSTNTRSRVATNSIPKRRSNQISRTRRATNDRYSSTTNKKAYSTRIRGTNVQSRRSISAKIIERKPTSTSRRVVRKPSTTKRANTTVQQRSNTLQKRRAIINNEPSRKRIFGNTSRRRS